jgi:hypothetical protein
MKTLSAIFAACCALLGPGYAQAGNLIDVQVISRISGRPLPVYVHSGKSYVVGTPGERYSLLLTNRTGARVMGVLSVDGVNAITGDTAAPNQVGYVLNPYQIAEIAGWRKSNDEVARFYFTPLPDSYAARTERPDNVGVIGIAAFREYVEPVVISQPTPYLDKSARDSAAPPSPAAGATGSLARRAEPSERLGTGHGEREVSPVSNTAFRRASNSPDETVSIWYDSRERLASRGILPRRIQTCTEPQAFPAHFVPDPRS